MSQWLTSQANTLNFSLRITKLSSVANCKTQIKACRYEYIQHVFKRGFYIVFDISLNDFGVFFLKYFRIKVSIMCFFSSACLFFFSCIQHHYFKLSIYCSFKLTSGNSMKIWRHLDFDNIMFFFDGSTV